MRAANKDEEFTKRQSETCREVATTSERTAPSDSVEAKDRVMMHWPDYSDVYEVETCSVSRRQDVLPDATFPRLPARHTFDQNPKVDPK